MDQRIAICGQQCSGKTTVADILSQYYDFKYVKFADPLYRISEAIGQPKNRGFMQEESDLCKKYFGDDIFIRLFEKQICGVGSVLCDDLRYIEEMAFCKKHNFKTVYVFAEEEIRKFRANLLSLKFLPLHSSEMTTKLMVDCDFVIYNNGSYHDLERQAWQIIL